MDYVSKLPDSGLPAGLHFNGSTGEIYGVPVTQTAPTALTVTLPSNPAAGAKTFYLIVNPENPPSSGGTLTSTTLVSNIKIATGTAIDFTPVTASGGTTPYKYEITAGTLPAGLSMTADGQITGYVKADAAPGKIDYTVKITDSNKSTAGTTSAQFSMTFWSPSTAGAVSLEDPSAVVVGLTVGTPVVFRPVLASGSGSSAVKYAIYGPSSLTIDRMYNQALVTCLRYKNNQDNLFIIGDEGFSLASIATASIAPVLVLTRAKTSITVFVTAFVAIFPTPVKSIISDITGGQSSPSTKDFTTTKNLIDAINQRFQASPSATADLMGDPDQRSLVLTQYRMGLEQACMNPAGTATAAASPAAANANAAAGKGGAASGNGAAGGGPGV